MGRTSEKVFITPQQLNAHHHKRIITVLNENLNEKDPVLLNYRSYKDFNENLFRGQLANDLPALDCNAGYEFKNIFMKILNLHAPICMGNNAPFMNQTLPKAIMHRSKLKNRYNKNPTEVNEISCDQ